MNKEEFISKVNELGIELTSKQIEQLDIYCKFLLEYNSHTNLTAIKEEDQVYLKHFYDSLTFIKAIDVTKYDNLLDIGTGAGFPGMVLKIVFPNLEVTLLDSNNKKVNKYFLLIVQVDLICCLKVKWFLKNKKCFYFGTYFINSTSMYYKHMEV